MAIVQLPTTYTDQPGPWLKLARTILLTGYLDVARGKPGAAEWVNSEQAKQLAQQVGLEQWPPSLEHAYTLRQLQARARELFPETSDFVGGLKGLKSRNKADRGRW